MGMYVWRSDACRAYAQGTVIAEGETVEDARAAAKVEFEAYAKREWEWLFSNPDRDDIEELNSKRAAFAQDIAAEPKAVPGAYIVRGSD